MAFFVVDSRRVLGVCHNIITLPWNSCRADNMGWWNAQWSLSRASSHQRMNVEHFHSLNISTLASYAASSSSVTVESTLVVAVIHPTCDTRHKEREEKTPANFFTAVWEHGVLHIKYISAIIWLIDTIDDAIDKRARASCDLCKNFIQKKNISTLDGVRLRKSHTRDWRKTLMISDSFFNFQTLNFINFWTDYKHVFDTWIWNASRWFLWYQHFFFLLILPTLRSISTRCCRDFEISQSIIKVKIFS